MSQNLPDLALYRAIHGNLRNWLVPGYALPTRKALEQVKKQWKSLKPRLITDHHPLIDDLIAEVESRMIL